MDICFHSRAGLYFRCSCMKTFELFLLLASLEEGFQGLSKHIYRGSLLSRPISFIVHLLASFLGDQLHFSTRCFVLKMKRIMSNYGNYDAHISQVIKSLLFSCHKNHLFGEKMMAPKHDIANFRSRKLISKTPTALLLTLVENHEPSFFVCVDRAAFYTCLIAPKIVKKV